MMIPAETMNCVDAEYRDRLAAKDAEIERLRSALMEIEDINLQWACSLDTNVERIKSIARAALSPICEKENSSE